jgi:hypothetical protein
MWKYFCAVKAINRRNIDKIKPVLLASMLIRLAAQSKAATQIDLGYYFDTRDFNTVAFFIQNKDLGRGFSAWGFSDFHDLQNNKSDRSSQASYFQSIDSVTLS